MYVEIITIGDELLIGQVVDTNSAWIGTELNKAGFEVLRRTSVRDREDEIYDAIASAMNRVDIVLTTGGLGPTKDDITKTVLCRYFDTQLVQSELALRNVHSLLKNRGIALLQSNEDQALVPEKATVINNRIGTAPILWFEKERKVLVSMPGVPQEMKMVMTEEVIPRLKKQYVSDVILHRTYLVKNFPESLLAETLTEWEEHLPQEIKLAYLPQLGLIRLRLTARGNNKTTLEALLSTEIEKLFTILQESIMPEEDKPLNEIIGDILRKRKATLSTAESCTGGKIAATITAVPGSSDYFAGSIVAYSNQIKIEQLFVNKQTLDNYGAVSEQTVVEMLNGALKALHTDYAIATTGIAGPGGGTVEKPVGTVWIAVGTKEKCITFKQESNRGREANIERTINNALVMLHDLLLEEEKKQVKDRII